MSPEPQNTPPLGELIACPQCDLLHHRSFLPAGSSAHCMRCNAALAKSLPRNLDFALALSLAGLVMLAIAHLNPVFGIEVQGQVQLSSLWRAAATLYADGAWFLSVLVIATTLVFPLVELLSICYVLVPLRAGYVPAGFHQVLRTMRFVKPWIMVEVLMLGVLIAVVKLSGLAAILLGAGVWSFAGVMLLMASVSANFDYHSLWELGDHCKAMDASL